MLMSCCANSCTQYSLHTQYMLLTHANNLLCLQLHTLRFHTQYMLLSHTDVLLCLQLHTLVCRYFSPFSSWYVTRPRTICQPTRSPPPFIFNGPALLPPGVATSHNALSSRIFETCDCIADSLMEQAGVTVCVTSVRVESL